MAKPPAKLQAKMQEADREDDLLKQIGVEAVERLDEARAQKSCVDLDLREALYFTRPNLSTQVSSTSAFDYTKRYDDGDDADELVTGLGQEVAEDFATEVLSAFFPEGVNWSQTGGESAVAEEQRDAFRESAKKYDDEVFDSIRASNFDAELGKTADPYAGIGTMALWIVAQGTIDPPKVTGLPYCEVEINVDEDGYVSDRFRVQHVPLYKVKQKLPGVKLPDKLEREIAAATKPRAKSKKKKTCEIVWAFWRDVSRLPDLAWVHVVLVDKEPVLMDTLVGEGSCPMPVMRFSPDTMMAWANGPTIKSLSELRTHDLILECFEDRADIATHTPISYPGEGAMDLSDGIEAGGAYAVRPGTGGDIRSLYFEGNPDLGLVSLTDIERRVRRKHFADYPEQRGDTPPTATQWIDEMARAQRRIGTPGLSFWAEGPREVFFRFAWLLEKVGKLDRPEIDGRKVALVPNNPATQARDQQKVQTGIRLLETSKTMFPMTSQAAIDEYKTISNMKAALKDEMVEMRDEAEVKELVTTILEGAMASGANFSNADTGDVGAEPE